jgi:ABC-2 type transport system ATP-binding protein
VRKLSLGERMKCEVAASLLHSPEVLFLDEPTIGLDVISQVRIREFLRDYNARTGITVILTSHYMADIEALCKRVIIINAGRAVFDGKLKELAGTITQRRIRLTLRNALPDGSIMALQQIGEDIEVDAPRVALSVDRDQVPEKVSRLLQEFEVDDLTVEDIQIESVIRDLFTQRSPTQN